MDTDEPGWTLIDDFFRDRAEGRSQATARRYGRVRVRLYAFLDTADMTPWLGTQPAALLEAERQLHDAGAFWTLFDAAELACCLPGFVHEAWWPPGLAETRTQIGLVSRLLPRLGASDDRHEAEHAVVRARRELSARAAGWEPPGHAEPPQIPRRFRRQEGPWW
jgi:hypothetical protein